MSEREPRYHEAGHTLDPNNPIPEDAPRAASTTEEEAEAIRTASEGHKEAVEAETEEANERLAERDAERAEGSLPKPSEALAQTGREPAPSEDNDKAQASTGVGESAPPEGTVQDVLDWAGDDPDRIQSALNAERAGQNRSTLVAELERRQQEDQDEEQ